MEESQKSDKSLKENNNVIDNVSDGIESEINTDDRQPYDYKTRYKEKLKQLIYEAVYLGLLYILSFMLLIANYCGRLTMFFSLELEKIQLFENSIFFIAAGLLGGTTFSMKYFYRVIARGYWSADRVWWRILSPWLAVSLSFIVGMMFSSGLMQRQENISIPWMIAVGFFAGYFADEAIGKMYEVATVIFGRSKK